MIWKWFLRDANNVSVCIAAILHNDTTTEYFIVIKRKLICKAIYLKANFFIDFCCYYCFNLEYPKEAKGVYYFFQDFVLEQLDRSKRTATYLSLTSNIKHNISLRLV